MAERDQPVEVVVGALDRHAAHADVFALVLAALGENDAERPARDLCVVEEQLVEIPHPIEQQAVGIGRLDLEILRHHRREARAGVGMGAVARGVHRLEPSKSAGRPQRHGPRYPRIVGAGVADRSLLSLFLQQPLLMSHAAPPLRSSRSKSKTATFASATEPPGLTRRSEHITARLRRLGGHRISSAGAVNEMDMAPLRDRGREARHLRRFLPLSSARTPRPPHSSVWISGLAPEPSVMSRPRSIACAHERLSTVATASGKGAPRTTCAAIALDSVQPVPCSVARSDARRGETVDRVRHHQEVDRVAVEMAALHEDRARAELRGAPLPAAIMFGFAHVRVARRAAPPPRRGSASGNRRCGSRLRRESPRRNPPLESVSPEEAIMTGSIDDEGSPFSPPRRWPTIGRGVTSTFAGPETERSATIRRCSAPPSMPILIAATSKSSITASICAATILDGTTMDRPHAPRVLRGERGDARSRRRRRARRRSSDRPGCPRRRPSPTRRWSARSGFVHGGARRRDPLARAASGIGVERDVGDDGDDVGAGGEAQLRPLDIEPADRDQRDRADAPLPCRRCARDPAARTPSP